ncbi:MAG: phosphate ABC transporter permease subunit PstC [Kiritimatiellia bacterium]
MSVDGLFRRSCQACAATGLVVAVAVVAELFWSSGDIWRSQALDFLFTDNWDPAARSFGAAGAIFGTIATTLVALAISVPLAFAAALFVNSAPPWAARPLAHALDLLAAIPSVIYGMWGLFVLCPLLQSLLSALGVETTGFGLLASSLVLALMVLPYVSAVMRETLAQAPVALTEAAMGVGCTRWEATWDVIVRSQKRGIGGGILIGLGRALGETMAVLFVCGGVTGIPKSLFDGCTTIAATLANDFAEAGGLHRSALFALGAVLLIMELAIQMLAQRLLDERRR